MSKILEGLEAALAYAQCDHDMIVQDIREAEDGQFRVQSRCDKCASKTTTFYPPGTFEIVKVTAPPPAESET